MTPNRIEKIKDVLRKRQPDLTVILENVHKPQNMAAIARTCDAVGIPEIHVIANRNQRQFLNAKSAGGCKKWVKTTTFNTVDAAYTSLRDRGFQILAAHFSEDAVPFREVDYTIPTAIVVGAELDGMTSEASEEADRRIVVPMMGMTQSLNVSVAAALVLFEAQRQREEKGFYHREEVDVRQFPLEWAYPSVAKKYRHRGLPMPDIDISGDIIPAQPLFDDLN